MEETEKQIPTSPRCCCTLRIDDVTVGFISKSQRRRFLRLRTYKDKQGIRHLISGLHSNGGGVQRAKGDYYYNHVKLSKEIGRYNDFKDRQNEKEL